MNITLPDGSVRALKAGSNGLDLANDIGPGLAKAAIAVSVNGVQKDLCDPINEDSEVSIITIDSDEGLEIMRHTLTAQVLARAVKNLYPDSKLAIGPTIKDGFYYDFEFVKSIAPDDLHKIEKEMQKIINSKSEITKKLHSKKDALKVLSSKKLGFLLVRDKKTLKTLGLISDGDIRRFSQKNQNLHNISVKEIMTKNPIGIDKNELAVKALSLMADKRITSLCVYNKKNKLRTIGILHIHNILQSNIS